MGGVASGQPHKRPVAPCASRDWRSCVIAKMAPNSENDARLIAPGPYPGSIVVFGSRARLLGPAFANATLILASSAADCSSPPVETDNA